MFEFFANHIWQIIIAAAATSTIALLALVFVFGLSGAIIAAKVVDAFKAFAKFMTTPLGQVCGVAFLCVVVFVVTDIRRERIDSARFAIERARMVEQSKVAAARRDEEIKAQISADAEARISQIQTEADSLNAKVAEYEKTLSSNDACRVTPDDLKRLRGL